MHRNRSVAHRYGQLGWRPDGAGGEEASYKEKRRAAFGC